MSEKEPSRGSLHQPQHHLPHGERKQRTLTSHTASQSESVSDAVAMKNGDLFLVSPPEGSLPLETKTGYGLYHHDCRYLDVYIWRIAGMGLVPLATNASEGFRATLFFSNVEKDEKASRHPIPKEKIDLVWERILDSERLRLCDHLTFHNYTGETIDLDLSATLGSAFEDVFEVRGLVKERPGHTHEPHWQGDDTLVLRHDGADGIERQVVASFSQPPDERQGGGNACFRITVPRQGTATLKVTIAIHEFPSGKGKPAPHAEPQPPDTGKLRQTIGARWHERFAPRAGLTCDESLLDFAFHRSLGDLRMLRSQWRGDYYIAAGLPWFGCLFGRDSIVAALELAPMELGMVRQTLRLLAKYQGQRHDAWKDEEPGRILHELRVGELARLKLIPHTPFYGSVDATPLFLILLAEEAAWSGSLEIYRELRTHIAAALGWIDARMKDGGYVSYDSPPGKALVNQGWKDSGDAIVDADGAVARPPITLVEVQAYVYAAWTGIARLHREAGDENAARALEHKAADLRARFNRDFWWAEEGVYVMALAHGGKPLRVVSSNAGHALWAGIADADKAAATAKRLLEDDMFSGWGIRTLSEREKAFNPVSYHKGTVWPHDNAIVAAGLRRYGRGDEAERVFMGILSSSQHFEERRLPEVFGGFSNQACSRPVRYPVACHPQAWAAGSIPYMLRTLLGLKPDGFRKALRVEDPRLPPGVRRLSLHGVHLGDVVTTLDFMKDDRGQVHLRAEEVGGWSITMENGGVDPEAKLS